MRATIRSGIYFGRYIIQDQVHYLTSSISIRDGPIFQANGSLNQAHITTIFPTDMTLPVMAMHVANCRCSFA